MLLRPNLTARSDRRRGDRAQLARIASASLVASVLLLVAPTLADAQSSAPGQVAAVVQDSSSTTTSEPLAGTTLDADARDDSTAVAPWLIWSGVAAGAFVLIGGLVLKRRMT